MLEQSKQFQSRSTCLLAITIVIGLFLTDAANAENLMNETFEDDPETRWSYFADSVMGGVSTGQATFVSEGSESFVRLTGYVSTDNNGGFIQVRTMVENPLPAGINGIRLIVRGNGETYFTHLRTRGMIFPWQYYQAQFEAGADWQEILIPLTEFRRSGLFLSSEPGANRISSIGIVAYGRDHQADVSVSEMSFY